jgi:hypothetical protein
MFFKIQNEPFSLNTFFTTWDKIEPFCVIRENTESPVEPSRWIENPEWKKKQIENKINHNNSLIGIFEDQILKYKEEIKELEKELKEKTPK